MEGMTVIPPSNFEASKHQQEGLVKSSYEVDHMGTNYDQDPKNVSKFQQCLSYANCDKMIKTSLGNVGLMIS